MRNQAAPEYGLLGDYRPGHTNCRTLPKVTTAIARGYAKYAISAFPNGHVRQGGVISGMADHCHRSGGLHLNAEKRVGA